jgi:serine/threonine-protein kinase
MHDPASVTVPEEASAILKTPPPTIGRFTVQGEIGRGSNGVVYAARDPVLGREVAIKAIPLTGGDEPLTKAEEGFLKEAQAAAGLNHPHIVTVFDAGRTDTLAYMAMERLHGWDLHEHMAVRPQLSFRQAAALMARVADAAHYAHKRGLIHRDIKPGNIFLTRDMKPKVLDFGVALAARSDLDPTHRHQLVGTPNYMSPEQALGHELDPRSDVFSIGSILYELVTGSRAFDGHEIEDILTAVIRCEPAAIESLRPDVPTELAQIIRRAMAKAPDDRYQTAGELRNDLAAFAGQREFFAEAAKDEPVGPPRRKGRQRRHFVVALGVVAGLAVGAWLLWPKPPEPGPVAAKKSSIEPRPPAPVPKTPAEPPPAKTAEKAPPSTKTGAAAHPPVERRTPPPVAAAPPADGTLALSITPWGEVFVNGVSRGVSPPLSRLALAPGAYVVEIRNTARPTRTEHIEVRSGQTVTLQHRF